MKYILLPVMFLLLLLLPGCVPSGSVSLEISPQGLVIRIDQSDYSVDIYRDNELIFTLKSNSVVIPNKYLGSEYQIVVEAK